jgi:hypothetical protein
LDYTHRIAKEYLEIVKSVFGKVVVLRTVQG